MRRAPLFLLALFFAFELFARVGGGESFSGGGSSGGGDGDGLSAELIYYIVRFLFWLTINYPAIGIPVDIVVIIIVIRWLRRRNRPEVITISTAGSTSTATSTSTSTKRAASLDALRRFDPNFSEITFSDFCYSLYGRAHHARGTGELDRYAPYLSTNARNALRSRAEGGLREVRGVVVGSFNVTTIRGLDTPTVTVTVIYEANYTEIAVTGDTSWYVKEQWVLERARDILSPPPEKAKADHCPRCGAALQTRTDGSCQYCGVKTEDGSFQWFVRSINLRARETRGPLLTANVPERGTNRPTVFMPHLSTALSQFQDWEGFERRVREVAKELQDAWSARDWERVRPLESEPLFQMHRYWIDAYKAQRLRNLVDDFEVIDIEPVKLASDAFYESITVRIFARGRDYTIDEKGTVVAGNRQTLRTWSEYWTFIRTRSGHGAADKMSCPNCGASVAVGATGVCDYCGGKLTTGTFDWVLSRIEQDEVYAAAN
jgi:hypothetical protein